MWTSRWHHVFVCENFWVKPGLGRTRGGAQLPWEDIVLSNYQPPNRQAQRGRKPLIWVFAYESAKEFPRLLCDSWTGSIWVSSLWRTTEEMWNIVAYVWCCRILSSEHNDHHHLNQKSCDSLQETPRFMPVHIFGRKKKRVVVMGRVVRSSIEILDTPSNTILSKWMYPWPASGHMESEGARLEYMGRAWKVNWRETHSLCWSETFQWRRWFGVVHTPGNNPSPMTHS